MVDHVELSRQHLERTLIVAEKSGDKEWAEAVRAELKDYEPEPEPEPEPESEPDDELAEPTKYAPKADWVDYAVSHGATREEAEASTKDELIEAYGTVKEA